MAIALASLAVLMVSGLAAAALSRRPRWATAVGAAGGLAGCALGMIPALAALSGAELVARWRWTPPFGDVVLGIDRLSAFFLVPLLVLAGVALVYSRPYLLHGKRRPLGAPVLFFNLLIASMVLIVLARDAIVLIIGWEAMGLSSFLVVSFEHEDAEVRRAAWIYLVASQIGAMVFAGFFFLLIRQAGATDFSAFHRMTPPGAWLALGLTVLATIGCGVKAGFVPLHVWLPEAHAAAPSHMSALMSGASIEIALYALLRALGFLPPAPWWGPALILLGFVAAAFGVSQALVQRDLKRVLAYSSIENMGLILIGLGVAFWGVALRSPAVAGIGALAAGFHLWSHAMMKGLLFLGAGSVLHGSGTRDLEALGGLLRRMPATSVLLILGALAIAGLPPLNGFVAEWLLVRGLFAAALLQSGAGGVGALLAVGALAFVGALAALSFVRLVGIALLGNPRSDAAARAHESGAGLLLPMSILAAVCVAVSLRPNLLLHPVSAFAGQLFGAEVSAAVESLAPSLAMLGMVSAGTCVLIAIAGAALAARFRRLTPRRPTWDCGYAAPTARMQYTASSFAQIATAHLLPGALSPPIVEQRPVGIFPSAGEFRSNDSDPITRGWYEPFFTRWADRFVGLRWVQQGLLHTYLFYILGAVVVALTWASLRGWAAR